ncbi:glycosyltransferase [Pedobacter sp. UYEF25]
MIEPTVSIVMITYGHENFITQAIDGVLMQVTNFQIELIVANDNSPDATDELVKKHLSQKVIPENIKILYKNHEKNLGMIANFFWALKKAEGRYIAICEGDDYWIDPLKLQKQVDFLAQNTEYGLVATDFNRWNESTGKTELSLFKNQPKKFPIYHEFQSFLLDGGFMAPCTWVLRKEFLPIKEMNYVDGTFPWLLDIFINSKVYVLPDATAVYRNLKESASHSPSFDKRFKLAEGILDIKLDYIRDYNLSESFKLKVLKKHYQSLLPIIIMLANKDELKNASVYIPRSQRTIKDSILFILAKSRLGKNILHILLKYR